jgi:LPS sulfotransferase NodH
MSSSAPGFIILAQGRTGSTLLADLLNSHPATRCEGEVLARPLRYAEPFIAGRAARVALSRKLWGFKAKHYQITECFPEGESKFLTRMQKRGWRVIWLRRKNFVQIALSTLVGLQRKTRAYNRLDTEERPPIRIDPDDFVQHLRSRVTQIDVERSFLEGLSYFEVVYEQDLMAVDKQAELDHLLAYLDVPKHPLRTVFRRTENRPLDKYIENWSELRAVATREGFGEMAVEAERQSHAH